MNKSVITIIVRIEFSPLEEIGVKKGHYWPEETTDKGPTQINAGACAFLKLIINRWHDSIETCHVLFMFLSKV